MAFYVLCCLNLFFFFCINIIIITIWYLLFQLSNIWFIHCEWEHLSHYLNCIRYFLQIVFRLFKILVFIQKNGKIMCFRRHPKFNILSQKNDWLFQIFIKILTISKYITSYDIRLETVDKLRGLIISIYLWIIVWFRKIG